MSGKLVFPGAVPPSALLSATNQAGARTSGMIPGAANTGGVSIAASGSFTSGISPYAILTTGGNLGTAEFQASIDGGTTLLGRKVDTTWDGNGAAVRTVLADTDDCAISNPCAVDTDGDGVLDRVLIAIARVSTTPDRIDILYTDDLTGAGAWATLVTNATGEVPTYNAGDRLALLSHDGALYLFSYDSGLVVNKSTDCGTTWSAAVMVAAASDHGSISAISLASGKMLVAYEQLSGSYQRIYCRSSTNGSSWSAQKQIDPNTASIDYFSPTLFQEADGKTVCIYYRLTATAAMNARQTTAADPAAGTWAAYSETLWAGADRVSAAIAPDGTIYAVNLVSDAVSYSKFKDGDANYSALATAYDPAGALVTPVLSCIGGALWCVVFDATNHDALLVLTKYIATYDASTAPAVWTGTAAQFIASGLWLTPSGSNASINDTFAATTSYEYGAARCLALRPTHPTRSVGDGAEWSAVFDLGANVRIPIDTICALGNIDHFHFQMNDTNVWTSPAVNTTVSFVRETIADAGNTGAVGKVTRGAGSWVPGRHAGERVRLGALASAAVYNVHDNDASALYVTADLSAVTGDLALLSRRAWASQTAASYRYLRILIDQQETAEGYYELPVVLLGLSHAMAETDRAVMSGTIAAEDEITRGGNIFRSCPGGPRRVYRLTLLKTSLAAFQELATKFMGLGTKPIAYIPNASDPYDWALCYPSREIKWRALRTEIEMAESV